ncbi:adenylate cyclase [Pelomyxa schiedti]|nr:adenylate cyclase [Pelomyxa schiedti]
MNVYRHLLVQQSVSSISSQMEIPPSIADVVKTAVPESAYTSLVPVHTDHSAFRLIFRGLAQQQKSVSNVLAGWQNSEGDHLYCNLQTYWGHHDSEIDSNVTFFWYSDNSRRGGDLIHYNLTLRDWWKTGVTAWNGTWTAVYMSANADEGTVVGYTVRPQFSVPVVIQFNLTANGLAFLAENGDLKIIAGTAGVPISTTKDGFVYAPSCSNETIREASQKWLNLTNGRNEESHFTVINDKGLCYVDVVAIRATGGLLWWSFLVTPERDFMDEIRTEENKAVDHAYSSLWIVFGCEVIIGVLSVVISVTLSVVLAKALDDVIRKLQRVSSGQLTRSESNTDLQRSMLKEIDSLNSEVTIMQSALESFSQYVPTQVVRYLCKNHMKPVVGVTSMHCTVMFLDVVDFTRNMEQFGAQSIIEVLGTMFESFSTIITKNNGCIDKYIGDAIMALWGCPVVDNNSEINACKAAAEILSDLSRLNLIFRAKTLPTMRIRIGLHSGEVRAGNVGSSQRLNYTVLGNTVNLASRLEPLSKELGTSVLVSDSIRHAASKGSSMFSWRALGHIQVRGFKEPVLVHEFLGFTKDLLPETKKMLLDYSTIDSMLFRHSSLSSSSQSQSQSQFQTSQLHPQSAITPTLAHDTSQLHPQSAITPTLAHDVAAAMDEYLDSNPDDFTIPRAKDVFVTLHINANTNNHSHSSSFSAM